MNCCPLVSDLVAGIRDRIKPHCHGGAFFNSEEVMALLTDINTVHALAIEIEEEKVILERQLRLSQIVSVERQAGRGGNVVVFPVARPRLPIVPPPDGGDAA